VRHSHRRAADRGAAVVRPRYPSPVTPKRTY
jgi:hypothetical protein